MRTPPLPADYLCQGLQTNLRKTLDTTQRHGQLCEGKSVGFSFGHGKGAACLPPLGGWCLVFRFWLDKVSRGGATQIFRLAHYFC